MVEQARVTRFRARVEGRAPMPAHRDISIECVGVRSAEVSFARPLRRIEQKWRLPERRARRNRP